jgi:DNA-binding MarR family transcriptional regulator
MTALYDQHLAPTGLKLTQFSLLATLKRLAGEAGMAMSDLAGAMDLDRTTLTRNLRPLLDQRMVTLLADGADARMRRAALTPKGRAVFESAVPRWRAAQDFVNATLGPEQVADLHDWLDRVTPAFRPAGGPAESQ